MGGGEREGEGCVNGNGAVVGGNLHQPTVEAPLVVVANGGGRGVEKVKFTVSVRGHQWSSARHVNETLQEFATAIQRNARRLEFIEEDDSIQRLQLAYADGSEPEDLDVDATLGDVIICMGDKQLVAIVNSAKAPPAPSANGTRPNTEKLGPASPMVTIASVHQKCKNKSDAAPNGYNVPDTTAAIAAELTTTGPKFMFPPYKPCCRLNPHPKAPTSEPSRTMKIAISPQPDPASLPFQDVERGCSFHPEYTCERLTSSSLPPLGPSRSNGKVVIGGCKGAGHGQGSSVGYFPNPTPSPAELANMLVRSSSHPHRMQQQPGGNFGSGTMATGPGVAAQCSRNPSSTPSGGFQSFASALLSRVPMMPNQSVQCPHGASTNIALLAQFLASQLRAFVPVERGAHPSADAIHPSVNAMHPSLCRENKAAPVATDVNPNSRVPPANGSNGQVAEKENYPDNVVGNGSPKNEAGNVKLSVSGSHEKDESSSSANVNNNVAPCSDGVDSEHPNGRSELVFLVNRRSKTGVGTHHLKMSDLSTYFHLSVVDAAKKLGVSQTTLKKACRKFGLKRWPGRKVRSLESTIHGLEHTIAVGQGAGLEELTEAYMRNEVLKLQQEMDQLVHGTPAQHSPAVRTADLYKRLYSRGWRSKYHSPGRHDVDINTGNHENRPSGLPSSAKTTTETTRVSNPAAVYKVPAGGQTNQQQSGNKTQKPKDEPVANQQSQTIDVCKETVMKDVDIEGLLSEPSKEASPVEASAVPVNVPVDNGAVVNCTHNTNGEKPSSERELIAEKEITFPERSPKRPKRECRTAAEGAVRQGLRSSTCAM